ncbi:helix-turn-helix domain-containing protein [Streptomyces sp. NBC_00162]|uniref:helix-turn-helix domain-containing protein n=1 Tax=Streptomyces sp. NBC_00162 TaxID=2903629 RepID=UPI00214B9A62|nr:helix-turn-helix domain-containing protein [Streptomyces sp. NBC_00162]UUU44410.1 helix-turn-helix domain-containing protein [Streptomyces sp. NBC_00162]
MAYGHKTPHQARQRATIVLLAARGRPNARIAVQTRLHVDTVRTWRGRFAAGGMPALADRKRSGRPVVHRAAGCRGQGAGLSVTRRDPRAAVALVVSGAGPGGGRPVHRGVDLQFHRAALAQTGRARALAVPVLDLRA